jgi:hypothetical protein
VKIFFFLLATTISSDKTMDAAATNLGSHGNDRNEGHGGDERRPSEEGAGGSGGKDKGKGKRTEAQEEAEKHERKEWDQKALEQCCEEVISRVAAEKEKIRDTEVVTAGLAKALSEMEELDAMDPWFLWEVSPELVNFHRSSTASGGRG